MSFEEIKRNIIVRLLSSASDERVHAAVVLTVTGIMGLSVLILSVAQANGKDQVGALAIVVPSFCGFGAYAWKKGKDGESTPSIKEYAPPQT